MKTMSAIAERKYFHDCIKPMDVYIRNNVYNLLEEEDFITCIETINTIKTHYTCIGNFKFI